MLKARARVEPNPPSMSGNDDGEGGTERLWPATGPGKRTVEATSTITGVISAEARGMINRADW